MDTQALSKYVAERLRLGVVKTELREELTALGWTEDEMEAAYREAVIGLGAPLPSEGNRAALARRASAVDVALNFFSFILLSIVSTALGILFFQVINIFFPDVLDGMSWYGGINQAAGTIHYAMAALIIGFPLYVFTMRLWFRKFREDEGRIESKLSKVLTYIVLLVTAVALVGDMIALVYTLLQGEITVRFFLKASVIFVIAASIFSFYYLERKKIQYRVDIARAVFQRFGYGMSVVVVAGIVAGFWAVGSPSTQRDRTLDASRSSSLSSLANCIESYAENTGRLPASLADLRQSSQFNYCLSDTTDPETGASFEYRVTKEALPSGLVQVGEFELCANFALATDEASTPMNDYDTSSVWYEHGVGRSCDTVTARLTNPPVPMTTQVVPVTPTPVDNGM